MFGVFPHQEPWVSVVGVSLLIDGQPENSTDAITYLGWAPGYGAWFAAVSLGPGDYNVTAKACLDITGYGVACPVYSDEIDLKVG